MSSDSREVNLLNIDFEKLRERLDALIGRRKKLGEDRADLATHRANMEAQAAAIAEQQRLNEEHRQKIEANEQELADADVEITAELEELQENLRDHVDEVQAERDDEDRDLRDLASDLARRLPQPEKPAKADKRKKK